MDGEGRLKHDPVLEKACRRIQGQLADAGGVKQTDADSGLAARLLEIKVIPLEQNARDVTHGSIGAASNI